MIFDRNIFVLLLLIAYVRGEPEWNLKYPHEVYVQDSNNPDEKPVIGCICRVEDKIEVLVPASINPAKRELNILYKNAKGVVVKTDALLYRETGNGFLLLLTFQKIDRSAYAEAVPIPPPTRPEFYYVNYNSIVAKVTDAYGKEITFTNSRPEFDMKSEQRLFRISIKCVDVNIRLVKGATLITELIREELSDDPAADIDRSNEGFIGMFEEHKDGFLHFNLFNDLTLAAEIIEGYRAVASGAP